MNAPVWLGDRWIEVDCVWCEERLIVELDGRAFHGTRAAFDADRERDRALIAHGWRVIRVTWRHLEHGAEALARDLCAALAGSRRAGLDPAANLRPP